MKIIVTKFELYPNNEPTGFAVGYRIHTKNEKSFTREIVLTLEDVEAKSEQEILVIAWNRLGASILQQVDDLMAAPILLGQVWYPPGYAPETLPDQSNELPVVEDPDEPIPGEEGDL